MDKGIIQFQSLSRCEAAQICSAVKRTIIDAYEAGFNVAANNYDKSIDDLFAAHLKALDDLGFGYISMADAASMLKVSFDGEEKI